ncbi:MAG TPA: hypothetical protein VFW49_07485 [Fluviicoccus sp.]|nr:hypothetical protein [Fluviicoccus sp.]
MIIFRFVTGGVLGLAAALLAWSFISNMHSVFGSPTSTGLIPPFIGGVVGGFISSAIAPCRKVLFAAAMGFLAAAILAVHLWQDSWRGSMPYFWCFPLSFLATFPLGSLLGRNIGRISNAPYPD